MNKTNFNQTGGFPLKTERLQELETSYLTMQSFGNLAGNLTIISGCEPVGSNVQNGFVFIDGELLEFREAVAAVGSTVIIIEENIDRTFENGTVKTVHTKRYATFGTAETSWLWSNFKKIDPIISLMSRMAILEKKAAVFQAGGGMMLWNKPANQIPTGWQEVVDWRGRMPVGLDNSQTEFNTVGKIGGSKTKTLLETELPIISPINGSLIKKGGSFGGSTGLTVGDTGTADFEPGQLIKPFGGGNSFSLLNPYRVVIFIEYIG
ncbi:hypothetical protein LNQ49_12715 [Flavobacterium sp. F-65]|uniref:Phage tail protein n=1 Tax=Flavobacterium pisciphilum TaxID=2893755 RepID=A0ABS8MUH6_9FLAO|nr:hypothetical protein [Flavobacterium sp. F-65]MCC9072445.1 hypothetical protein [Flavobacterium sp. F-65]